MPAFIATPSTRRAFLKTTTLGAVAISLGFRSAFAEEEKRAFRVALLSDTHIPADANEEFRGFAPVANLKKITSDVVSWKPELVIVNGDLARQEGTVADYEAFASLIEPIGGVAPVCMSMGNHDDRANFLSVIKSAAGSKQKIAGKHVVMFEHEVVRIIVLDSLMYVNKVAGQLGKAQRTWLSSQLPKLADRPAVVFVHHTLEDNDSDLADAEQMFRILGENRHVKAVFYGHSHIWSIGEKNGLKMVNLPSVAYPFRERDPIGWVEGVFTADGVDLTLRASGSNMADNGKKFVLKWS